MTSVEPSGGLVAQDSGEHYRTVGVERMEPFLTTVVSDSGLTNMAKWARLYRAYGIPVYAVFDSDSNGNDRDAAQSRDAAMGVLRAIGVEGGAASHPGRLAVGDRHTCFDPKFEVALRTTFSGYLDAEAGCRGFAGLTAGCPTRQ